MYYTLFGREIQEDEINLGAYAKFLKELSRLLPQVSIDPLFNLAGICAPGYRGVQLQQPPVLGLTNAQIAALFKKTQMTMLGRGERVMFIGPGEQSVYVTVNRDLSISTGLFEFAPVYDPAAQYLEGSLQRRVAEWALGGDAGTSSKTIAVLGAGLRPTKPYGYPHDGSDFGRCYRLLKAVPELREQLPVVAQKYPPFAPFVERWDQLEQLYAACLGADGRPSKGKDTENKALYAAIKECDAAATTLENAEREIARARP